MMKNLHLHFKTTLCVAIVGLLSLTTFAQTFTRITSGPVVNTAGDSRSVNWVDVNNDGLIDLFISNGKNGGQNNMLYLNAGGGAFTQVTGDPIVLDNKPSDGATFADCDNDGDLDAFVVNWYQQPNLFYTNNGNATFTQITGTPVVTSGGFSETASWGDYDNDGLLDLYVTRSGGTAATNKNLLYHNDGGNTFTKILTGTPVTDSYVSRSVNWTDLDSDGDLDLFVTNEGTTNNDENIYRNDGGGTFTKITTGPLLNNGAYTMSSSWGDYDNDGDLDVYLANDQADNALFRNDGNFNFIKITGDTVGHTNAHSFSSAWSDIDNDADLDLFVTNSYYTATKQINFLYLNDGNGSFTRINNTIPAQDSSWSYGCAFGDYDNDGFEDLAVATVRFNNVDEPDFLYHNDGNSNHWITIKLVGTITNKSAIGTKIRIRAIINGVPVWQMREISAQTSYCGQNDLRAHFGLGTTTVIDSIKIEWLSGTQETYTAISGDQFITITEGQGITSFISAPEDNNFSVFPNPAKGKVTIKLKHHLSGDNKIILTNNEGKNLKEYCPKTESFQIDFKKLVKSANGIYYISLYSKTGSITRKIIAL
jgi:enediyne biosynthesis protein E4